MRAQRPSSSFLAVVGLAFLALLSTGAHTVRAGETLAHGGGDERVRLAPRVRDLGRPSLRVELLDRRVQRGSEHLEVLRRHAVRTMPAT